MNWLRHFGILIRLVRGGICCLFQRCTEKLFFELSDVEILAMKQLLHAGRRMLTKKFNPAGFNIGVNVGEAGGQTVMHCHFHLIPRYIGGDDPNPAGGIRKLLPADHKKNS